MGFYEVKSDECKAVNFFAGEFPVTTDVGTALVDIPQYAPVAEGENGITVITAETLDNLMGISADSAGEDEPVVFYMTGEYFADALDVPEGISIEELKKAFRKKSIFLK